MGYGIMFLYIIEWVFVETHKKMLFMCNFLFVKRGKVNCGMSLAKRIQKLKKAFTPKKVEDGMPSEKILSENSRLFVKEAYKALRTNLIFSLTETGGKVILITSSGAAF